MPPFIYKWVLEDFVGCTRKVGPQVYFLGTFQGDSSLEVNNQVKWLTSSTCE